MLTNNALVNTIEGWSSRRKQAIAMVIDGVMMPFALWSALTLRHGHWHLDWLQLWPVFLVTLACVPLFVRVGLYRHVIRHMGSKAISLVFLGGTIIAIVLAAVTYMAKLADVPRSALVIFWLLSLFYVAVTRFAVRMYADAVARHDVAKKPVAIYGAGPPGAYLAYQLERNSQYRPVAFIDDDRDKHGDIIQGLTVHPLEALSELIDEYVISQVLVAQSAAEDRRRIVGALEPYPVHVRLIPNIDTIVSGTGPVAGWRDVDIGDLLGRDEVAPLPHLMRGSVANRAVLVTGAGGSIGSELCRQILGLAPRCLIVLDQTEPALHEVERELQRIRARDGLVTPVALVLGSVLDDALMERTMREHGVETVYHAAAYKHVDLVERNVIQGIKNNTFGTLCSAQAAMNAGVLNFILISTDKAVRTRGVMGASKRLAEMVLQALQEQTRTTRFSMVRFGNVLVSSGSVVPMFMDQIDKGGPVTVTHRDATRYFMTISEAAALVLQAASMAEGGDVFLLDMGNPVNILDLAKKIIRLSGYKVRDERNPHGDIEIEFTGLRPGEKLNEELLVGNASFGTEHRKIMRAVEPHLPWSQLAPVLANLKRACDGFDVDAVREFIERLVEGADLAERPINLPRRGNVLTLPER